MGLAWVTAALFAVDAAAQDAAPANTLHDLGERLGACLHVARGHDQLANGSEVTVLFALKRDGSLLGRPRITHSNLIGDLNDQRLFLAGVISAIDGCLPLDVSPGLGGAIAGRPIALRVVRGNGASGSENGCRRDRPTAIPDHAWPAKPRQSILRRSFQSENL